MKIQGSRRKSKKKGGEVNTKKWVEKMFKGKNNLARGSRSKNKEGKEVRRERTLLV